MKPRFQVTIRNGLTLTTVSREGFRDLLSLLILWLTPKSTVTFTITRL